MFWFFNGGNGTKFICRICQFKKLVHIPPAAALKCSQIFGLCACRRQRSEDSDRQAWGPLEEKRTSASQVLPAPFQSLLYLIEISREYVGCQGVMISIVVELEDHCSGSTRSCCERWAKLWQSGQIRIIFTRTNRMMGCSQHKVLLEWFFEIKMIQQNISGINSMDHFVELDLFSTPNSDS